jgi:hypothetical protein
LPLHPALTEDPSNWLTGIAVQERLCVFIGQTAGPCFEPFIYERSALRVRVLQGSAEFLATPAIQFVSDGISDKLAAILFPAVDISNEVNRQGHCNTSHTGHFILLV